MPRWKDYEIADDFFFDNYDCVPDFVLGYGKTWIKILVDSWDGSHDLKVKMSDVIEFYRTQANNIVSGIRTLAGHHGDWRPMSNLADLCLSYFKAVNIDELRSESRRVGLEPRF